MSESPAAAGATPARHHDRAFFAGLGFAGACYILLIVGLLASLASYTTISELTSALESREIRYATQLSFISATITALLSLWFAVPIGYLMARVPFRGKNLVDSVLDIPIVLPPMVIGLGLLIMFQTPVGRAIQTIIPVTYRVPSVILAQFSVACAFAVRTMRVTFDQIDPRCEDVARTLGASHAQAFARVALPQAGPGMLSAGMLAWARALGEFGPILVFAGATRMRTEVLPSSVFLELSTGDIEAAVAVSLIMVVAAVAVLVIARTFGLRRALP